MFDKLFAIEEKIEELDMLLKCGIYRIRQGKEIIVVEEKIKRLENALKLEEKRLKELYF
jgi:hypothetical protein